MSATAAQRWLWDTTKRVVEMMIDVFTTWSIAIPGLYGLAPRALDTWMGS